MTVPEFKQMLKQVGSDFLRYKRWIDIEDKLLSPYPSVPPQCLAECHIGHLLHGLVKLAKTYCNTPFWCDKICIVDTSSPRALDAIHLADIDLILGVVASNSHWALVASRRKADAMMLYDGGWPDYPRQMTMDHPIWEIRGNSNVFWSLKAIFSWLNHRFSWLNRKVPMFRKSWWTRLEDCELFFGDCMMNYVHI